MGSPCRPQILLAALVVLGGSLIVLIRQVVSADGVWDGGASLYIRPGARSRTPRRKTSQLSEPWLDNEQSRPGHGHHHDAPTLRPPNSTATGAQERGRRLAIVVPCNTGDVLEASASLAKWPSKCHSITRANTDLIMYYAGGEVDHVAMLLPALVQSAGRCFASTRLVHANLRDEVRTD